MESEEMFSEVLELASEEVYDDSLVEEIADIEIIDSPPQQQPQQIVEENLNEQQENIEETLEAQIVNKEKSSTANQKEKSSENRLTQLPLTKIKNIMKLDPDLQLVSNEALFLVTKATELFIDSLAKESFVFTRQSKKKIIQKRDVDLAISSVDSLLFLDGATNI